MIHFIEFEKSLFDIAGKRMMSINSKNNFRSLKKKLQ